MENLPQLPIPLHIIDELHKKELLGAGSTAVIYGDGPERVHKRFFNNSTDKHREEAEIQIRIQNLLKEFPVRVPDIYYVHPRKPIIYMERIHPPSNFAPHLIHLVLGYNGEYNDCLWYIDGTRVTRGFFAGPETINSLAQINNWHHITINNIAHLMGSIIKHLISNCIIPIGIEWSLDKDGRIWLSDFGSCKYGYVEPVQYFYIGYKGRPSQDLYTPITPQNGYNSYYDGYFGHPIEVLRDIDDLYFCISPCQEQEEPSEFVDCADCLDKPPYIKDMSHIFNDTDASNGEYEKKQEEYLRSNF